MKGTADKPFITTLKEKCRVCYTCVRECPSKAIRIADGQAEVVPERCIGCGNCVRVCSQHAKQAASSIDRVRKLLAENDTVTACIAPSFPAEFPEVDYRRLVGMIHKLGFAAVHEVAFGADLVAHEYTRLLAENPDKRFIATSCPGVVGYVERYEPEMVKNLAPIVSPMVACARVMHRIHGDDAKVVFLGPCIAKKVESASDNLPDDVDDALTFVELRQMFAAADITPGSVDAVEFDGPYPNLGALFPITRGMLQAADIEEDLMSGNVVSAAGRQSFVEAIREFASGDMEAQLLEVLCCDGCIMGAGMSSQAPLFSRRGKVSEYVRKRMHEIDKAQWKAELERFADIDLLRTYTVNDQRIPAPREEDLRQIMQRMGKFRDEDELNCGACGYDTCREHAIAIYKGLAENEMCLPNTIEKLRSVVQDLNLSNEKLARTREALMQSEKLASMGQLAAGIAHEVNNPLGVVLMYAHLLMDEADATSEQHQDLKMVVEQADRCKKIVSGLLNFARQNKVVLAPTDLRALIDQSMQIIQVPDNVEVALVHEGDDMTAEIDADQIVQVLTNLTTNALAAMPDGGTLTLKTWSDKSSVGFSVSDTGTGITRDHMNKIFEPFFTTKQIGKGTGLGLAVTYGIIKMHRGDVTVDSNSDPSTGPTGTTFNVTLPRQGLQD